MKEIIKKQYQILENEIDDFKQFLEIIDSADADIDS